MKSMNMTESLSKYIFLGDLNWWRYIYILCHANGQAIICVEANSKANPGSSMLRIGLILTRVRMLSRKNSCPCEFGKKDRKGVEERINPALTKPGG